MKKFLAILAAAAALIPPSTVAHHSFAMFDPAKEIEIAGTVVEWQWTSPHTWLYVLVPAGGKEPDKWSVEGGNPGLMRRDGFAKDSFSPGDKVKLYILPLRSGEKGGALNQAIFPDGKVLGKRLEALAKEATK